MVALNKTYRKTLTPYRSAQDSGHRFYSPEISRWLNRDPIGERGGLNRYGFVGNRPILRSDRLGLIEVVGWNSFGEPIPNDPPWPIYHPVQAPIHVNILPAGFVGPPGPLDRGAAASCPVSCGGERLGTLHAMPLEYHAGGTPLPEGHEAAAGIRAQLHFIKDSGAEPEPPCCCTECKFIQVVGTSAPIGDRGAIYVDTDADTAPYYAGTMTPAGIHNITGVPIQSTASMYDTPERDPSAHTGRDITWEAEACVVCIREGLPDRVLGQCVDYGFQRNWNAALGRHDAVQHLGPLCGGPSGFFLNALGYDPLTSDYDFVYP
jgi:RHS repeat-associated protein